MPLVFEVNSADALLSDIIDLIRTEETRYRRAADTQKVRKYRDLYAARSSACTLLIGLLSDAIIRPTAETEAEL